LALAGTLDLADGFAGFKTTFIGGGGSAGAAGVALTRGGAVGAGSSFMCSGGNRTLGSTSISGSAAFSAAIFLDFDFFNFPDFFSDVDVVA
jgi:hypothetical protein